MGDIKSFHMTPLTLFFDEFKVPYQPQKWPNRTKKGSKKANMYDARHANQILPSNDRKLLSRLLAELRGMGKAQ